MVADAALCIQLIYVGAVKKGSKYTSITSSVTKRVMLKSITIVPT